MQQHRVGHNVVPLGKVDKGQVGQNECQTQVVPAWNPLADKERAPEQRFRVVHRALRERKEAQVVQHSGPRPQMDGLGRLA